MKTKEISLKTVIIISALSLGIGSLFVGMFNPNYKSVEKKFEYVRSKHRFEGTIDYAFQYKNAVRVRLKNGSRYSIPWAINENYEKKDLLRFLKQNDSIVKHSNSDTLFVFRKKREYIFVFYETIGGKVKNKH